MHANKSRSRGTQEPQALEGLLPVGRSTERFGKNKGPKVLLLVGHDGLRSGFRQFLILESCIQNLGPRWQELLSNQSITRLKRFFSKAPKTISLRDENVNAIRIILQIAHLQFNKLPKKLDFEEIVHLADVAARYDASTLLIAHIDTWLAPYRERLLHPGYEEWLFIAHQFGYEKEYLELAKHLAVHCRVDPSGVWLLAPESDDVVQGKFPIDTLEHIHEGRRRILASILEATYEVWVSIVEGLGCKVANADDEHIREGCAAINLFKYTKYLQDIELFPMFKETTTYQPSPYELSKMLCNIHQMAPITSVLVFGRRGSAPAHTGRHGQCHVGHQVAVRVTQVLEKVIWPVELSTLVDIKLNADKLETRSQRHDEAGDFLTRQCLLKRKFKDVHKIEAALDTDPNVLNVR